MTYRAPLVAPEDLAWLLAGYAREARHRVEHVSAAAEKQLTVLKESLEAALEVRKVGVPGGKRPNTMEVVRQNYDGVDPKWMRRLNLGKGGTQYPDRVNQ